MGVFPDVRDHIHYRIAVKDVCLTFDNIQSSEQLVRMIYYCIASTSLRSLIYWYPVMHANIIALEAHYWAYTKYDLLHRDISSGNVMIRPRHIIQDGKKEVQWQGVLIDWELATNVRKDGTDDKTKKKEKTVCQSLSSNICRSWLNMQ